jgi:hypothetical protein
MSVRLLKFKAKEIGGERLDSMAHFSFTISNSGQSVSLSEPDDSHNFFTHTHTLYKKARGFHRKTP